MIIQKRTKRRKSVEVLVSQNVRIARSVWPGELTPVMLSGLRALSRSSGLALASGEILLVNEKWYVTNAGLLRLARENGCRGIHTRVIEKLCEPQNDRSVFKAIGYKSPNSKSFVGYGDADPSNISPLVRGAEMRVAETRAVNRALRKAYGIALSSVEELGCFALLEFYTDVFKEVEPSLEILRRSNRCNPLDWSSASFSDRPFGETVVQAFQWSRSFFLAFAHRANTAFRAISLRCSAVSLAARTLPPLDPPILPSATACGFLDLPIARETLPVSPPENQHINALDSYLGGYVYFGLHT